MKKLLSGLISGILCISLALGMTVRAEVFDISLAQKYSGTVSESVQTETVEVASYLEYLDKLDLEYSATAQPASASIEAAHFSGIYPESQEIEGKSCKLQDSCAGDVTYAFSITTAGLYTLQLNYYMAEDSANTVKRNLMIDGEALFKETSGILLLQHFSEDNLSKKNYYGDQLRGDNLPAKQWYQADLTDSSGICEGAFLFYFSAGEHSVTLQYAENDVTLGDLQILPAKELPTYKEIQADYVRNGYESTTGILKVFEAESTVAYTNDVTIRRENSGDVTVTPASSSAKLLNVYGGSRWDEGNRTVAWEIEAPVDGLYQLGIASCQNFSDGISITRQIKIDDEIPFAELSAYAFPYSGSYRNQILSDENGEPYLFYLTAGRHTLSMTVKLGEIASVIADISEYMSDFSEIQLSISKITGNEIDPNYDYEFFKKIDGLEEKMKKLSMGLAETYAYLKEISDGTPSVASSLKSIQSEIDAMLKNPFLIAKNYDDFENAQTTLGTWYLSLKSSAMAVDKIYLASPEVEIKQSSHNIFKIVWVNIKSLLHSFARSYNEVSGSIEEGVEITDSINVWVARGSEWAEAIKQLADSQFTPATGIEVKLNTVPSSQLNSGSANVLMLSLASGKQPDVAMAIANNSPVEFAIRDAALDLSQFDDYAEVEQRFYKEALTTYRYNGGVYALPETMNFKVLFYRTDIIAQYGIPVPNTREELYSRTLPLLYRNGFSFYYPRDDSEFILQYGGQYYTDDGKESALGSAEVYNALKEETELYTQYAIPVTANFYNRFRTGEMPMGISDYTTYLQLLSAAPEISGKWAIAPIPGMERADGTVDRSVAAFQALSDMILSASAKHEQSWTFLKWWTSAEVQLAFATEVEAVLGEEARWNTSNKEAFSALPWKAEDLEVITTMLESDREVPVVLGGYYTTRYLTNAWNSVVQNGAVLRDELEDAVVSINKELRSKQEEYGVNQ